MKNILGLIIIFIVCSVAGFLFFNITQKPKPLPVAISFSHYVHTTQHKIKCKNCHQNINNEERAGIPNIEICSLCHSTIINPASDLEKQVFKYVTDNKPIPWESFYVVPDYVYFSHRRHVKIANIDCVVCHGDMTTQTSPVLKNVRPFEMKVCFDCHQTKNITTECANCHH